LLSKPNPARIPNPTEPTPQVPIANTQRFAIATSHCPLGDNAATDKAAPYLQQTED